MLFIYFCSVVCCVNLLAFLSWPIGPLKLLTSVYEITSSGLTFIKNQAKAALLNFPGKIKRFPFEQSTLIMNAQYIGNYGKM